MSPSVWRSSRGRLVARSLRARFTPPAATASICLRHWSSWFRLAKMWITTLPSNVASKRLLRPSSSHRYFPVVCENSADRLRGGAVIKLEHAAESLTAPYWARSEWRGLRRDELVAQTLVRSFLVIMIHERADGIPEVFLAERHDSV